MQSLNTLSLVQKMIIKLMITQTEKQLLIDALADYGIPIIKKDKRTTDDKKKLDSIEKLIHQIAFGRDHAD